MCDKKERKRDRRWYLFPVSTLGAVYFAVHGGTGRFFFFSRRDGAVCLFFRGGTGRFSFFSEAGRGNCFFFPRRDGVAFFFFRRDGTGRFFFFFRGPGRDGCFWRWQFFWRDGAKSLHRPAKGGLNRPASRPCKALQYILLTQCHEEVLYSQPLIPSKRLYVPRRALICTILFQDHVYIYTT